RWCHGPSGQHLRDAADCLEDAGYEPAAAVADKLAVIVVVVERAAEPSHETANLSSGQGEIAVDHHVSRVDAVNRRDVYGGSAGWLAIEDGDIPGAIRPESVELRSEAGRGEGIAEWWGQARELPGDDIRGEVLERGQRAEEPDRAGRGDVSIFSKHD